ncbi:MAG: hypothetical protein ABIP50_02895 [Candidatus Saccharimonadales bacterium]
MMAPKQPSHQTLRELREITKPLQAINHQREALILSVQRLRHDTIMMADGREVGRYRGDMTRVRSKAKLQKKKAKVFTEIEWLAKCGELSKSFHYSYPVGQRRAAHMVNYAMQDGYQLPGEWADIIWLVQGWEDRINFRNRYTDQRVIMTPGMSTETRENGSLPTIYFEMVTIEEYELHRKSEHVAA